MPSALTSSAVLAEGERLGLRQHVGDEDVVMAAERGQGMRERDEVTWDQPRALVDKLIKGMLPVGAPARPQ